MSAPGVGAIVALTYVAAIDDPTRFKSSKGVGAYFGLTPTKYRSGEKDITGGISKTGDSSVCAALQPHDPEKWKPVFGKACPRAVLVQTSLR